MKNKMIALVSALMLSNSYATTSISYNIDSVLIGTVAPSNATTWGQITINETGDNSVSITVGSNLNNDNYYSSLGLNLVDDFDFKPLTFQLYQTIGDFNAPTISVGNNIKSGGGGIGYDVWFDFSTSNRAGGIERFNKDDTFTYYVTGVNIKEFNAKSNPVVLHAQNLTGGASSWVGCSQVPEPSAMLLGSIGILFLLRRKR